MIDTPPPLILFLIERESTGYDESQGGVIAATCKEDVPMHARTFRGDQSPTVWDHATITRLGTADLGTRPGIICTMFNAG